MHGIRYFIESVRIFRNVLQNIKNEATRSEKRLLQILHIVLLAQLQNIWFYFSQIMPWHHRKQMVLHLIISKNKTSIMSIGHSHQIEAVQRRFELNGTIVQSLNLELKSSIKPMGHRIGRNRHRRPQLMQHKIVLFDIIQNRTWEVIGDNLNV